ncbi:MAG: DUF2802 domain-containing protein [Bdellovibrionaceae bacterium]|nr:DUF2802 domain-containing protein [Pseudobdellovibrionaceae bacterium]
MDLVLFAGVAFVWVKLTRPQKDDPRLSRGLQLLQSKIAVLEDLSDQIENQVQQLTGLLESKAKEVQTQILAADKQIQKIETSMTKSMEVAQIFQDRIPHEEIIERQNTLKYVKAARMAHQGASLDEISEAVDLSRGEVEMIAKVNRDQLQFAEDELPEWAKKELGLEITETVKANAKPSLELKPLARQDDRTQTEVDGAFTAASQLPQLNFTEGKTSAGRPEDSLANLGEKFRQSLNTSTSTSPFQEKAPLAPTIEMPGNPMAKSLGVSAAKKEPVRVRETAKTSSGKSVEIQKVVFPKLNVNDHLS